MVEPEAGFVPEVVVGSQGGKVLTERPEHFRKEHWMVKKLVLTGMATTLLVLALQTLVGSKVLADPPPPPKCENCK